LKDEKQIVALLGKSVIDIGAGMGYWGILLKSSGRKIIAIELSKQYVQLLKMLCSYFAVIRASADALPFKPNSFDTALALEIIEHVNKQGGQSLVREAKRVSNCVIMSTPKNLSPNLDLPDWVPETERHLSYWEERDFHAEGFTTRTLGESILAVHDGKK
jgi:2-polyprenyl-3-methyl-5-hydroxy-6-metoxy-1,4-benzoquinol methylase